MIKYQNQLDHKIAILDNMLIQGNSINAYYVLYPYNYSMMDRQSVERHIEKLHNALSNLYNSLGEVTCSIFNLDNLISKQEIIQQLIKTVQLYDPAYKNVPEMYQKYISSINKNYTMLTIKINTKNYIDIENQSIREIIQITLNGFIQETLGVTSVNIDEQSSKLQEARIRNILQRYVVPAPMKLIINAYINSIFPSYNLVYDQHIVDNHAAILTSIKQEFIPHLGWFEMSNSGIVQFGGTPRTTYGSVLTILQFPDAINTQNFNIKLPGMHVNMHMIPKDKAILKFKRMRAEMKQEWADAGLAMSSDNDADVDLSMTERALRDIREGRIATELEANILVLADTKEKLDEKKKKIISILSDINVICNIAANQTQAYMSCFIKNNPKEYYHMMDLEYALSFQLDQGVLVGDQDSKYSAPVIGIA